MGRGLGGVCPLFLGVWLPQSRVPASLCSDATGVRAAFEARASVAVGSVGPRVTGLSAAVATWVVSHLGDLETFTLASLFFLFWRSVTSPL